MSLLLVLLVVTSTQVAAGTRFRIPGAAASNGLKLYAEQAGRQVLFPYDEMERYTTNAVQGEYEVDEALRVLLNRIDRRKSFLRASSVPLARVA